MTSTRVLVLQVLLVVAGVSAAAVDDLSCLPQPGEKYVHAGDCCKDHNVVPESMMTAAKLCMKSHPLPPPDKAIVPLPELRAKFTCMGECIFQNLSLLTEDKQFDKDAVKAYFSSSDADTLVTKCLNMYENDIDATMECKSGSEEFIKCLNRQAFLDCPEDKYSGTEECDSYKAKVTKCPMMPVLMGPKPPHPHHHHDSS